MGLFGDGGLFGGITDELFGSVPKAKASGSFQNVSGLGKEFSQFLLDRLRTPVRESEEFQQGRAMIQDTASASGARARHRLGDAANTGGFLDSGAVTGGLMDLERSELQSTLGAERDLFAGLLARQTEGILPYLSGASGESMNIQGMNIDSALSQKAMNQQFFTGMASLGAKAYFGMG